MEKETIEERVAQHLSNLAKPGLYPQVCNDYAILCKEFGSDVVIDEMHRQLKPKKSARKRLSYAKRNAKT